MKYSFITQHKNTYPISLQCQVLGVKRQGYYHYRRYTETKPADPEHQDMLNWVKEIAKASDGTYLSRRMKVALNCLGFPVSRNKAKNFRGVPTFSKAHFGHPSPSSRQKLNGTD